MKHKSTVLWLTGLSGAGKSTISRVLEYKLRERGYRVEILDGDVVRENLSKGLGFSREDRDINVRRVAYVANLLSRNGVITIVSMISPYRKVREELKSTMENFIEVYVNASLEICELRDVKGLYVKARAGQIKAFTGIDDPYEEPLTPDIVCDTEHETIEQSVNKILATLSQRDYVQLNQLEYHI